MITETRSSSTTTFPAVVWTMRSQFLLTEWDLVCEDVRCNDVLTAVLKDADLSIVRQVSEAFIIVFLNISYPRFQIEVVLNCQLCLSITIYHAFRCQDLLRPTSWWVFKPMRPQENLQRCLSVQPPSGESCKTYILFDIIMPNKLCNKSRILQDDVSKTGLTVDFVSHLNKTSCR